MMVDGVGHMNIPEFEGLTQGQVEALMQRIHSVPIIDTLQMDILRVSPGECDAFVPRAEKWDGIYKTFHGGMLATIADTVTCWAILTLAGAETKVATTDFNVRFLAPCNTGVVCHGKVLKFGRTLCPAEAEIRDENKKLVAVAQVTYIRL